MRAGAPPATKPPHAARFRPLRIIDGMGTSTVSYSARRRDRAPVLGAAVPTANKDVYARHAADAAALFKEFGVARMVECWGDDVPDGKVNDFKGAVQAKSDETVVFSWFEYPDKATRDAASKRMMEDPRMEKMSQDMPFDGKRMFWGGFKPFIALKAG